MNEEIEVSNHKREGFLDTIKTSCILDLETHKRLVAGAIHRSFEHDVHLPFDR